MRQLPLGIALPDSATFETLIESGQGNAVRATRAATKARSGEVVFLHGEHGTGKTHTLQAACHLAADLGQAPIYLSLRDRALGPEVLAGLETLDLIALDDLEAVANHSVWERALFNLFNEASTHRATLLLAARHPPAALEIGLPDLRSRLGWGATFRLGTLDDTGKLRALQRHALARGLELTEEVGRYLLGRHRRDLPSLLALLDRLDHGSLVAQRRLTIPFVREALEESGQ